MQEIILMWWNANWGGPFHFALGMLLKLSFWPMSLFRLSAQGWLPPRSGPEMHAFIRKLLRIDIPKVCPIKFPFCMEEVSNQTMPLRFWKTRRWWIDWWRLPENQRFVAIVKALNERSYLEFHFNINHWTLGLNFDSRIGYHRLWKFCRAWRRRYGLHPKGDWEARLWRKFRYWNRPNLKSITLWMKLPQIIGMRLGSSTLNPLLCRIPARLGHLFTILMAFLEIVIEPKMFLNGPSRNHLHDVAVYFGKRLSRKTCLDMGCGTAVLAILASMKRAKPLMP